AVGSAPDEVSARPSPQAIELPEPVSYRLKRFLLGPPLVSERLSEERLDNVTALGVLSPDCISSTAYGPEEILRELIPAIGVAAYSLLMPITFAVIAVLFFVTLSYREVVTVYTKAGGAYVVGRENFGIKVAQIAAVALIIDYVVTVAVQTAAGTDAVTSAFPALNPWHVEITVGVVLLLIYGNLRGIREAGRVFALPTYLFIVSIGVVVIVGIVRAAAGQLHHHQIHLPGVALGHPGNGFLMGASLFVVLRAFANGGSSLTGLEAISNGVATFRRPEGSNARRVLVVMSTILGALVLGVSYLAVVTHAVPFRNGSPTVISQEARFVLGSGWFGKFGFYAVQGCTMLVLYTGANTSFNGFPNLASFVAKDAFLPPQLTRRGHRLVFSNGIIFLGVVSIALLLVTHAQVNALVAVYAIGVFTGFTMAGAGMVRYHLRHRARGWRRRLVVNGFAAVLSAIVVVIFAVTKFTEGAWVVVVLGPVLVVALIRLHAVYVQEQDRLAEGVERAAEAPVLKRHVVLVMIERLDLAAARALQYARSLSPDEPRAVHFVLDTRAAQELEEAWTRLGISRVSLELIECPDRRLVRAALELAADIVSDGQTELSVLLPRRVVSGALRKLVLFHGRTGDRIAAVLDQLPNVSATVLPFQAGGRRFRLPWDEEQAAQAALTGQRGKAHPVSTGTEVQSLFPEGPPPGTVPIGSLRPRQRAKVAGRVRSVRVQPGAGISTLECTLADETGQIDLVFQGRRLVPGIQPGAKLIAEGMVGQRARRLAMINPSYTILQAVGGEDSGT
ncbi:MAG: amino acid/polyamine/organocation transporter, superfamily, partial [Acidimicrobiaceae bacterium]|nr:amino acid/polyamine/organocation transporter, superfamily [Acidimicrobiaceae bacterium]